MNILSLFSGIGGLDLGLERAGMTCVGQVEIDPFCRRVLAKHWPEVPRHDDVHTCVNWWRSEPRPTVHVVAGGFPCQPVSVAGRRLAQADDRWLWPPMWAVICDLRPDYAIVENVPGLLGRGMGDVLGDLAAIGYDAEWDCIPAAAVGAPHRRDRVFVVAYPAGDGWGAGRSGRPVGDGTHWAEFATAGLADADGEARRSAAGDAIRGVSGATVRVGSAEPGRCGEFVADANGSRQSEPGRVSVITRRRTRNGGAASRAGISPTPRRDHGLDVIGRGTTESLLRGMADGIPQELDGTGSWDAEWPDTPRVAVGVPCRADRLRALGNAVVPQVAEHIGRLVMAAKERTDA